MKLFKIKRLRRPQAGDCKVDVNLARHFTLKTLSDEVLQKFERLSNRFELIKTEVYVICRYCLWKWKNTLRVPANNTEVILNSNITCFKFYRGNTLIVYVNV